MAIMIPEVCEMRCRNQVTKGERKIFDLLKKNLSDEYTVYFDVCVNGLYPDFIVVGKDIGIIVLEIKDYKMSTIIEPPEGDGNLTILTDVTDKNGDIVKDEFGNCIKAKQQVNPYRQARMYSNNMRSHINKDLKFNYNYIVVFTNLYEQELKDSFIDYDKCMESNKTIYKDSLDCIESGNIDLKKLIKSKRDKTWYGDLDEDELKAINEWIYPLSKPNLKKLEENIDKRIEDELIDLKWGRYILQGVSGSGKTIYLTTLAKIRLRLIEQYGFSEKILITAFNHTLVSYFKKYFEGYNDIDIKTKHELFNQKDKSKKYDLILIDEGQDFALEDLKYIIETYLNREKKEDYVIAMDGAQNIYKKENFRLNSLSEDIIIRELTQNYRNNKSIFEFSNLFLNCNSHFKINKYSLGESNYIIDDYKSLKEDKQSVKIEIYSEFENQMDKIKSYIERYKSRGINEKDMCIMYISSKKLSGGYFNKAIGEYLDKYEIGYYDFHTNKMSFQADLVDNNINISTIHSSKGFEYKIVFLCGIEEEYLGIKNDLKKLVYTGMTRAKERLIIFISEENNITKTLKKTYNFIYGKDKVKCINCGITINKFDKYCYGCAEPYLFDIDIANYLKCRRCNSYNELGNSYCTICSSEL